MPAIPDDMPPGDREIVAELLERKPPAFTELTQTQAEAFRDGALGPGNHVLVAETGNGKTFVAEATALKALQTGEAVAYLVPSKALVGEKRETLAAWAGDRYVIKGGSGYADADIIVATFESYFEAAIRGYVDRFETVVLDDFHEIYDPRRGVVIEKAIAAALDTGASLLAISATIGNPHTIAQWLDAGLTISSEPRAVPITEYPVEQSQQKRAVQIKHLIDANRDKGPFLVFNFSRADTEARAESLAERTSFRVDPDIDFRAAVEDALSTGLTEEHETLIELLQNGVGYHHARMDSGLRALIEDLTEQEAIQCVFCTTTLSYGFDSPVQSTIVADLTRWTGDSHAFVGMYEYVQWIGRAGRDADRYDEAYAFPIYNREEAPEQFQFDRAVEDKDLEDITSHLTGQSALRWLVLELVATGWTTESEIIDFVRSTLAWTERVEEVPTHIQQTVGVDPAHELVEDVQAALTWLSDQSLVTTQAGYAAAGSEDLDTTPLGDVCVEFEHATWFSTTIVEVLELVAWLGQQGTSVSPEALVERAVEEYDDVCDLGTDLTEHDEIGPYLTAHGLEGSTGTTAGVVCWYWCSGLPIAQIKEQLDTEAVTALSQITGHIATALEAVQTLYRAPQLPAEPAWLESLATRIDAGVPDPDVYLIDSIEYFGRKRYNELRRQINQTSLERGGQSFELDEGEVSIEQIADWDPGRNAPLVERLHGLYTNRTESMVRDVIEEADYIGTEITRSIVDAIDVWPEQQRTRTSVPFAESIERTARVTTGASDYSSGQTSGRTTLDDFT